MAYMIGDRGPYPNKVDEYCGNHLVGSFPELSGWQSPAAALVQQEQYLATMRFGRPRPCKSGTTKEMAAREFVGLYAKTTRKLRDCETEVPTPDSLREPDEER